MEEPMMDRRLVRYTMADQEPLIPSRCPIDNLSIDVLLLILESLRTAEDIIDFAIAYPPAYATYRRHGHTVMQNIAKSLIPRRNRPVALSCLFITRYPACAQDVLSVFKKLHANPPRDLSFLDVASLWSLVRLASRVNDLAEFYLYAGHSPISHDKFWLKFYKVGHVVPIGGPDEGGSHASPILFDPRRPKFAPVNDYFWRLRRRSRRRARRWPSVAQSHAENMIYQLEMRSRYLWLLSHGHLLPYELGGANLPRGTFRFVGFIESVFFHLIERRAKKASTPETGKLARLECQSWTRARCCLGVKLWACLLSSAETDLSPRLGRALWMQMTKLSNDRRLCARIPQWHWEMRDEG
ncbi:hypothetical protein ESCO_001846 [Escovopsis weberi]|uniref:Uncharacterized protein n=1 Tax=Escovopsis weberi TaxID=150374 RepID=A0A0M8N863_ESCWE|nr:hypothetical protein ESCO_001846 [Escovopsis weberi]